MREQTTEGTPESRPEWATLEVFAREKIQTWLQRLLEEEVTELLGREKSVRHAPVDAPVGYRNGFGKPRRIGFSSGTVTVRRPRVRGVSERFESRVLPLFAAKRFDSRKDSDKSNRTRHSLLHTAHCSLLTGS